MSRFAAVVLCAGQGTRMKSAVAKVLHPVCGRPLGGYALRCLLDAGAKRVVAVVGRQAAEIKAALATATGNDRRVAFALQREPRGTAHAVRCAEGSLRGFAGPIVVTYGDVPLLRAETVKRLLAWQAAAPRPLSLVTARTPDPTGYGRVLRNDAGVLRIVEEKDCTEADRGVDEINAGIYAVDAAFLWTSLRRVAPNNAKREFYLTDLAAAAAAAGQPAHAVPAAFEEVRGVNDRVELARAEATMRARINTRHLLAGVTLTDPDTTYIDDAVAIGEDTVIGPGVVLSGVTRLGRRVRVGAGCVIGDSEIADGAEIRPHCVLDRARVGPSAIVGPFARLRPGTDLEPGVHIGNFVETKNARLGPGTKANHLTYLGDCVVGRDVNVGAGTITCNYDGVNKHLTRIGDGVFVGSDSQFVAPVSVGKGAYIGAGSTVVEDVPAFALAIARARQVVKPGWARARAKRRPAPKVRASARSARRRRPR